jgi:hypothetical protein
MALRSWLLPVAALKLISDEYRALQHELHSRGNYGVSGQKWAENVRALASAYECDTVLDYGSGRGTLRQALALGPAPPFMIREYDPCIPEKAGMPQPADLVFCGDVLEHIEPEFLGNVLDHLRVLTLKIFYAVIATQPAAKYLADGRNAHLIIEGPAWWLPRLQANWAMISAGHNGRELQFLGASA